MEKITICPSPKDEDKLLDFLLITTKYGIPGKSSTEYIAEKLLKKGVQIQKNIRYTFQKNVVSQKEKKLH